MRRSLTSETTSSAGENLQVSAVLHYKHDAQASESSAFPIPTRLRFELVWLAPFRGLPQATGSASLFPAPVYLTVGVASGSAKSEIELVVVQPWNCWFDVLVDEPLR